MPRRDDGVSVSGMRKLLQVVHTIWQQAAWSWPSSQCAGAERWWWSTRFTLFW